MNIATTQRSIVGVVDYDMETPGMSSVNCSISAPADGDLERGVFVRIGDGQSYYVGQIVAGPFFANSRGTPSKARYLVEIMSCIDEGAEKAVVSRPTPGTPVELAETLEVHRLLGISGDIHLGSLTSDRRFVVSLNVPTLTRHVGVFGTTGAGKSNTIQVLMEEAHNQGFGILVFDIEGEYIEMDKPTDRLIPELATFGIKPFGVKDLRVYVPNPSESKRADAIRFGIEFSEVEKDVFAEVAGLNRIEQLYFQDLMEKVAAVTPESQKLTLAAVIDRLAKRLRAQSDNPTLPPIVAEAHNTLYGKLTLISGLDVVDVKAADVDMSEVFKTGRVSVVDFSDATDSVRNIVIADLLKNAWRYKIANPESPRLLIVIEEAHAFISREKRDEMLATLMLLIETARRGRKRGLILGIVTQQPTHLPTEILELCNTRIMHRISSTANIEVLRQSTGNVPDEMWGTITSLTRGEAIISTPQYYSKAISMMVRPCASKRIATE